MWIQQWDSNVVRLRRLGQFSFPLLLLFDHYTFFDTLLFFWYLLQDSCCCWGVGEDGWEVSAIGLWRGGGWFSGGGGRLMRGRWRWLWWLAADCTSSRRFMLWHHYSWHVLANSAWMWIQQWDSNVVCLRRLGQFSFLLLLLFDHYIFFHTLLFFWYLSQDSCCWTVP